MKFPLFKLARGRSDSGEPYITACLVAHPVWYIGAAVVVLELPRSGAGEAGSAGEDPAKPS